VHVSQSGLGAVSLYLTLVILLMIWVAGADINAQDQTKYWSPLLLAAYGGHDKITNYLIDHGADVNAKTRCLLSPTGSTCSFPC
jgi:ankyrin repeat protein